MEMIRTLLFLFIVTSPQDAMRVPAGAQAFVGSWRVVEYAVPDGQGYRFSLRRVVYEFRRDGSGIVRSRGKSESFRWSQKADRIFLRISGTAASLPLIVRYVDSTASAHGVLEAYRKRHIRAILFIRAMDKHKN